MLLPASDILFHIFWPPVKIDQTPSFSMCLNTVSSFFNSADVRVDAETPCLLASSYAVNSLPVTESLKTFPEDSPFSSLRAALNNPGCLWNDTPPTNCNRTILDTKLRTTVGGFNGTFRVLYILTAFGLANILWNRLASPLFMSVLPIISSYISLRTHRPAIAPYFVASVGIF